MKPALGILMKRRLGKGVTFLALILLLFFFFVDESIQDEEAVSQESIKTYIVFPKKNTSAFARKLLQSTENGGDANRIGTACTKDDIVIAQGATSPLPNGIPSFTVQIMNVGASGCGISNIHVSCGWFSSVRLINPTVFRRLYYDDCIVNDGEPLGPGEVISFDYANSFSYPLSVTSADCC